MKIDTQLARFAVVALLASPIVVTAPAATAKVYDDQETAALVRALSGSKVSLLEGLHQVGKDDEAAISAKFEFDDNHKLSLSVYTAEKGLAVDAEHNVLKEFSGSPEATAWAPEAEVFKDIPHVARASEHLALMSVSHFTLADIVAIAQKRHKGTVFSVTPAVIEKHPVAVVLIADKSKVVELDIDMVTGQRVGGDR
ncbi:MAG TPA: PepSY domain-containing protein [Burkholderiales bacterium]|nr:PepSY domain-containing protein [Burkholderiales bacterium]